MELYALIIKRINCIEYKNITDLFMLIEDENNLLFLNSWSNLQKLF